MAHHNTIKNYSRLSDRINLFPQGAPPSSLLFEIFKILFNDKEAGLVSLLPIKPFTSEKAAGIWKMRESHAELILSDLADRGLLLDAVENDDILYSMPPPMAGFFEFSLMRHRKNLTRKHCHLSFILMLIRKMRLSGICLPVAIPSL